MSVGENYKVFVQGNGRKPLLHFILFFYVSQHIKLLNVFAQMIKSTAHPVMFKTLDISLRRKARIKFRNSLENLPQVQFEQTPPEAGVSNCFRLRIVLKSFKIIIILFNFLVKVSQRTRELQVNTCSLCRLPIEVQVPRISLCIQNHRWRIKKTSVKIHTQTK